MTFFRPISVCWLLCALLPVRAAPPASLLDKAEEDSFGLVSQGNAARILTDPADFKVVSIAAGCLANDIHRVTGRKPGPEGKAAIIIGTIGRSKLIDGLISSRKLDVSAVRGKWESFVIATVKDPLPGVSSGLVIAGSDRRGTAFGVFDLSETIGVSPWVWWADVAPTRRDSIFLSSGRRVQRSPSVKYRGIFINDEDWGLQPWAAKTFEPETKDIGPKTYAKVCELLLRLKANYLWPAMHPSTKAFNFYPKNREVADDYAIVMGSSHAEPMLRNNVDEWDKAVNGEWDYEKNRDGVLEYWEQRVKENGRFENTYTIGMRGIHDSGMPGGGSTKDKVARLQRVIADQRKMLAEHVNKEVEKIPQVFVPYKEVLTLYQNGLKVPDDVTLVWPDDNHGYIRQLPSPAERKRAGGSGVYYHISYWGAPEDYLWLCTTPPTLIWEEMRKAYDHGARDLWVLNIGDIKPGEIGMEFFLRMAWDVEPWKETAQMDFLTDWAKRNFGEKHALDIATALDGYYRLNFLVKPEHLLKTTFSVSDAQNRTMRFNKIRDTATLVLSRLPAEKQDAFYQLVMYPIICSALMNDKHLGHSPTQYHESIQKETRYYNERMSGGKWKHMMSSNPRKRPVFQKPTAERPAVDIREPASSHLMLREAERADRTSAGDGVEWKVIPGLGTSGDSIALLPTTSGVPASAVLEYDFTVPGNGPAKVIVHCIPTHAIHPGEKLRYSASIDDGPAAIVDIDTAEFSKPWAANVLRGAAIGTTESVLKSGKHTLRIRPLDPGVVFDRIVMDFTGMEWPKPGSPAK